MSSAIRWAHPLHAENSWTAGECSRLLFNYGNSLLVGGNQVFRSLRGIEQRAYMADVLKNVFQAVRFQVLDPGFRGKGLGDLLHLIEGDGTNIAQPLGQDEIGR